MNSDTNQKIVDAYQQLKDTLLANEFGMMKYFYYQHGLVINSKVCYVDFHDDDKYMEVFFEGGYIGVNSKNDIKKAQPPSNLITDYEVCFSLTNEYGGHIGFLYVSK